MEALYLLKNVYHDPLALQAEGGRADAEGTDLTLARPREDERRNANSFGFLDGGRNGLFCSFAKPIGDARALVRLVS